MTDSKEREDFERWYVENVFDLTANPIGSRQCGMQWEAWQARAKKVLDAFDFSDSTMPLESKS